MTATLDSPEKLSAVEAVNLILRAYGEARISSLGETADAVKAEKALIMAQFQALSEGYSFCTTERLTLSRDVNGYVYAGINVTQVVPTGSSAGLDVVVLGDRLFDREDQTYVFDADVEADVTIALPWDDLPQPAAWYVAYRAAFAFVSDEKPGDPALRGLQEQIRQAKVTLEQYDSRLRRGGLVGNNPHFHRMRKRRQRSL